MPAVFTQTSWSHSVTPWNRSSASIACLITSGWIDGPSPCDLNDERADGSQAMNAPRSQGGGLSLARP